MPNVPDMFNIEWLEALLATLALISAAVSVHLWHRAAAVPNMPDQPSLTLSSRQARAGSAAAIFLDSPDDIHGDRGDVWNHSTDRCLAATI
jgi:hypothetical protein